AIEEFYQEVCLCLRESARLVNKKWPQLLFLIRIGGAGLFERPARACSHRYVCFERAPPRTDAKCGEKEPAAGANSSCLFSYSAFTNLLLKWCSPVFVPSSDMTEVMISSTPMEDMRLSPSKDRLSFQIFPDPSDFDRCCKLKDRLPSIVVEPTEGEVESGELRWPPEEFLVSEEEEEEEEDDQNSGSLPNGQPVQNLQH
uniref:Protein LBH n=1 Tax=Oryzias latipes TaxID=8090 RepID=A0A3P9L664_ORYLA